MNEPIIPMNYRGYVIDFAPEYTRSKYQFVHEDYDGDEDKRIGVKDTVAECMLDIDDQVIERQADEIFRLRAAIVNFINGGHFENIESYRTKFKNIIA